MPASWSRWASHVATCWPPTDVRYAVIVLDPDTGTRVVAVVPWPARAVDATGCLDTISGTFGPSVASTVIVLPVDQIPLTEQGKPNRPEIRRLGRELAARSIPVRRRS